MVCLPTLLKSVLRGLRAKYLVERFYMRLRGPSVGRVWAAGQTNTIQGITENVDNKGGIMRRDVKP